MENRRATDIFGITIETFVARGEVITPELEEFGAIDLYPSDDTMGIHRDSLSKLRVLSDQKLVVFPTGQDVPADYVSVGFTDRSGRRWKVDTSGYVARVRPS